MNTTQKPGCDACGVPAGHSHHDGYSAEFGGIVICHNAGYDTAHGTANYHRSRGDKARVFYEPAAGWAVQVAP